MDTTALKRFAQTARTDLIHQVEGQLKVVLAPDSLARREEPQAVSTLENRIKKKGKEVVVDEVAYTWFNRFCALRFMDVNHYNKVGVVSSASNQIHPEILTNAMNGLFDKVIVNDQKQARVLDLLNNRILSRDAHGEAYRILLVSYCNALSKSMGFLFERITDYTELLLPTNLLAVNSILADLRRAMTEETCKDVEVIGWLYQFYISERKDEVFAGFKKGKKAEARDIPAATQLFTPHWIVQYLLDNSLGRLWMLNNPSSRLIDRMEYYIKPEQEETDFLIINKPEEIKVCDPACGSGHMLTYAFDLLYAIYEEEGYDPVQIPVFILENNLYGIEIDKRAADLAAFALMMKARNKSRSFLSKGVEPNIKFLEKVDIDEEQLKQYISHVGKDFFTFDVRTTIDQFKDADLFGSLIVPELKNPRPVLEEIKALKVDDELFYREVHDSIIQAIEQAEYLSQRYHVGVTNPPYMGGNANQRLADFSKGSYPDSKSDLCTMFIERNLQMVVRNGLVSMITMQSWMFLSSYEKLREKLVETTTLHSMAHLGTRAFDSIGGEVVSTTAFVIEGYHHKEKKGSFFRLIEGKSEKKKIIDFKEALNNPNCGLHYRISTDMFRKIPGSSVGYWISKQMLSIFQTGKRITDYVFSRDGLTTGNNKKFINYFWEIDKNDIFFKSLNNEQFWKEGKRYAPIIKGGSYRKWFGNNNSVIKYDKGSYDVLAISGNKLPSREFYFRENINWNRISSSVSSFRYSGSGLLFESASLCAYAEEENNLFFVLSVTNSCVIPYMLKIINPTTNMLSGYFDQLRIPNNIQSIFDDRVQMVRHLIDKTKFDWDSYETSWDFTTLPLLEDIYRDSTLRETYGNLRSHWNEMTLEIQRLEEENNRIFIEAYGLKDELTPEVPLEEITLTCNPRYRYRGDKSDEEFEALLLADTMREFISYAVGCMFGRYSLDKPSDVVPY